MRKFHLLFLKIIAILLTIGLLFIVGFYLPLMIYQLLLSDYEYKLLFMILIILFYLGTMPWFIIFHHSYMFLNEVERHEVFELKAVKLLGTIRRWGFISSGFIFLQLPIVFFLANKEKEIIYFIVILVMFIAAFTVSAIVSVIRNFIFEEMKLTKD